MYLFNGNLFLVHRINQLNNWILTIKLKKKCKVNIEHINLRVDISLNDSWLSGFTDAEGCFNVSIVKRNSIGL